MKTYLITGAAKGLGKALAEQLTAANHQVILLDKDLKALNALYDNLVSDKNPDQVALYPMDLLGATLDDYIELQENISRNYEQIEGIFLNAASLPAFTPIEHFDYKQWYEVIQTNLNANFHLIQQSIALMRNVKNAKVIAITDQNLKENPAYYGAYGVAKAGLTQMLKSLAAEHCEQCINCYTADLKAFATETRSRLFPGENPTTLPQVDAVARFVIRQTLDQPVAIDQSEPINQDLGTVKRY